MSKHIWYLSPQFLGVSIRCNLWYDAGATLKSAKLEDFQKRVQFEASKVNVSSHT